MSTVNFSLPNILLLILSAVILSLSWILVNKADATTKSIRRGWYWYLAGISIFCFLSTFGFFPSIDSFPPRFPLMFIFSFLFFFLILFQSINKSLQILKSIPFSMLIYFQSFRILLEIIIYLFYKERIVPKEITFEGRSFDLLVGIAALIVGYIASGRKAYALGIAFNIFGLLSIVNIISIAVPSFPSPFRVYDPNYLPTFFPGILVPLFLAPMAIYVHLLSLKQLIFFKNQETQNLISKTTSLPR